MKYYGDGGERVYGKSWWMDQAADAGKPVIVELQKRDKGEHGFHWCSEINEFVDTREECGMQCKDYDPRNGKSGYCRNASHGFTGTGEFYEITEIGHVKRTEPAQAAGLEGAMMPYDFLRLHPSRKEYKNKRTGKEVKACIWSPGIVEITFVGIKYSKTGSRLIGQKTRTMKKDEFNRKYYLHDNGI